MTTRTVTRLRVALAGAALALCCGGNALAAPIYTLTDLGPAAWEYSGQPVLGYVGQGTTVSILGFDANGQVDHHPRDRVQAGTLYAYSLTFPSYNGRDGVPPPGLPVGYPYTGRAVTYYGPVGGLVTPVFTEDNGARDTQAIGMNKSGTLIGVSYDGYGTSILYGNARIYTPSGGPRALATLDGTSGAPLGINDQGQIVGQSPIPGDWHTHAFISDGAHATDLNELIATGTGLTLINATAINDRGQIVGQAIDASFKVHEYLLTPTPVPEPGAAALAGLVLAGYALLGVVTRWKKSALANRSEQMRPFLGR